MTPPITYRTDGAPAAACLAELDAATGGSGDAAERERAVRGSGWVATAWHHERLVGLLRAITDGAHDVYLQELRVHPDYHHQGVGKELLDRYDARFGAFPRQVAVTESDWTRQKLAKRGFLPEPAALTRSRPVGPADAGSTDQQGVVHRG